MEIEITKIINHWDEDHWSCQNVTATITQVLKSGRICKMADLVFLRVEWEDEASFLGTKKICRKWKKEKINWEEGCFVFGCDIHPILPERIWDDCDRYESYLLDQAYRECLSKWLSQIA